jgi:PEP-CTERM motif
MKRVQFLISAAALALVSATSASAALITYTVIGSGQGTIGGNSVGGTFTITGVGDTDNFFHPPQAPTANVVVLNSLSISLGGQTALVTMPTVFFTNPPFNFAGFNSFDPATNTIRGILGFRFAQPNSYDGLSSFGPVNILGGDSQYRVGPPPAYGFFLPTDLGPAQFDMFGPLVNNFEATLAPNGAVPEPASWAMMIAGFGIAGAAMRRKATVKVSYS